MYTLMADEKTALVMIYTQTAMVRGKVVLKAALTRVNTWLRTQGAPDYIHLLEVQLLDFTPAGVKNNQYDEFFLPTQQVVAFHLAPPLSEPVDYDEHEANRIMQATVLHLGTFTFRGSIRTAAKTPLGGFLESSHSPWMTMYDISVSNSAMPTLQYQVPMALVSPAKVLIGMAAP